MTDAFTIVHRVSDGGVGKRRVEGSKSVDKKLGKRSKVVRAGSGKTHWQAGEAKARAAHKLERATWSQL